MILTDGSQTDVPSDTSGSYVTATAVTTRTATTHEDLSTNAKTQQMEEKTVATTTKQIADRQEQKVITQEVKTTVTSGEQVSLAGMVFFYCAMLERLLTVPSMVHRMKLPLSLRCPISLPPF